MFLCVAQYHNPKNVLLFLAPRMSSASAQVCRVLLMSTNRNFGLESKMALFSAVLLPAAVLRAAVEWLKMAS